MVLLDVRLEKCCVSLKGNASPSCSDRFSTFSLAYSKVWRSKKRPVLITHTAGGEWEGVKRHQDFSGESGQQMPSLVNLRGLECGREGPKLAKLHWTASLNTHVKSVQYQKSKVWTDLLIQSFLQYFFIFFLHYKWIVKSSRLWRNT